jgi:hypothetical protein
MQKSNLSKDSELTRSSFYLGRYTHVSSEDGLVELLVVVLLGGLLTVLFGSLFL